MMTHDCDMVFILSRDVYYTRDNSSPPVHIKSPRTRMPYSERKGGAHFLFSLMQCASELGMYCI